jgi:hypothetical protein
VDPRTAFAPLILATLAACGTPSPAPSGSAASDPYDPVVLNESAAASIREGDYASAWILLERASRLASHDKRIAGNLALVRAYREGKSPAAEGQLKRYKVESKSSTGSGVAELLREPPPIWTTNQQ